MQQEVVLVGTPNVGKSVIFNALTGRYVNVSNYPGTTVEVAGGRCRLKNKVFAVVDTPGMYSLSPLTEEERVTRALLLAHRPAVVVHVADARNLRRGLQLTLELIDAGLPLILDLNLMDEAAAAGIRVDVPQLSRLLGIPVVATAAVKKIGLENLKAAIADYRGQNIAPPGFSPGIEAVIAGITARLTGEYPLAKRMMALLLLQGDEEARNLIRGEDEYSAILAATAVAAEVYPQPLGYVIAMERQAVIDRLLAKVVSTGRPRRRTWANRLDRLTRQPLTGVPLLLLVLYYGLYKFVGGFGAGVLVEYINDVVFAQHLTPLVTYAAERYLPWEWLQSMLVGDYGLFTLGLRYAVAIILPVVGTFFLVFALLEDCGYLPRLAMLLDGLFRTIGLNGRAVIPMTLGLGCGTMAVFVTRTLETRRERLLATFLLSLAIPCSAQLGVVLALLSDNGWTVLVWAAYIGLIFLAAGWLSAKILPGERSPFYLEIPPLRLPVPGNVAIKAYTRMVWYFAEILPVFILAGLLLWLGDRSGVLAYIIKTMEPLMGLLGLPPEAAETFLLGFFRRDYGAAGLYDLAASGLLSDRQLLVAAVTITLFVPCVAQFLVMIKERGLIAALAMMLLIALISFASGCLVYRLSALFIS
ncbi:MAG: ferrous iron transport protein B [Negativicutes bacterium]|nr:ferrous iron transport protein B [Negativicutes bacterium]